MDAAEVKVSYEDYQKTIISRPYCDPIKGVAEKEGCFYEAPKIKSVAKNQGYDSCSCVSFARWRSGINVGPIGLAKNHPINSTTPVVGGLVVTRESWTGHIAVVEAINGDLINVVEANYVRCRVTYRTLSTSSPVIKGYYNP